MGTAGAVPLPEDQAGQSFLSRFVGVFLSPGETFEDIVRKPDFLAPLIVAVLATVAVTETMLSKIGIERIMRTQIAQSSRGASMTPDQIDQAVAQGAKIGATIAHISGVVAVPIIMLVIAAVGLGIVNLVFGSKTNFATAFSITCYANLVAILGAAIAIVMILFGDPEHFNPSNPVPTSLGFFVDAAHTPKPLVALASSIDLFSFWLMALLGIGFSAATRKQAKFVSVFLCFFGLWVVWVLIKMGLATLG
jgi:hypothetical protein